MGWGSSAFVSHFNGDAYRLPGEKWPCDDYGQPLELLFQIIDKDGDILPGEIKVLQFFYKRRMVSRYDDDWLIKAYKKFTPSSGCSLKRVTHDDHAPFCTMEFEKIQTLPSWEELHNIRPELCKQCIKINNERPWTAYFSIVTELIKKTEIASQIGGYPQWVQADETPHLFGKALPLLFQLDSDDEAGFMFQDMGLLYCFMDEYSNSEPVLILQSC